MGEKTTSLRPRLRQLQQILDCDSVELGLRSFVDHMTTSSLSRSGYLELPIDGLVCATARLEIRRTGGQRNGGMEGGKV